MVEVKHSFYHEVGQPVIVLCTLMTLKEGRFTDFG